MESNSSKVMSDEEEEEVENLPSMLISTCLAL
jgi:hypothetical protein